MDSKNNIIINYVKVIADFANTVLAGLAFTEDEFENRAIIKTLDVENGTLRSYSTLLQQEIDNY